MRGSKAAHARVNPPPCEAPGGADAGGVHLFQRHHDARQRRGVEEDLAVQELVGAVGQAANDVAVQGVAAHPAGVLGLASLAAAVERRHGEAGGHVAKQLRPFGRTAPVAVEHEHGRTGGRHRRLQQLGVDPGAAHAGEVEVSAAGAGHLESRIHQLDRQVCRVQLGTGALPVFVEVRWPRIAAAVALQLVEREVEQSRHLMLLVIESVI